MTWNPGDQRCDQCDNGLNADWICCPYCGAATPQQPETVRTCAGCEQPVGNDPWFKAGAYWHTACWRGDTIRGAGSPTPGEAKAGQSVGSVAAQPPSAPVAAPDSCPHCIDETDCANAPICAAVAAQQPETVRVWEHPDAYKNDLDEYP